jgi:hypothetical protein
MLQKSGYLEDKSGKASFRPTGTISIRQNMASQIQSAIFPATQAQFLVQSFPSEFGKIGDKIRNYVSAFNPLGIKYKKISSCSDVSPTASCISLPIAPSLHRPSPTLPLYFFFLFFLFFSSSSASRSKVFQSDLVSAVKASVSL